MKRFAFCALVLAALVALPALAQMQRIHEPLQERLFEMSDGEFAKVLVVMEDRVDAREMTHDLDRADATLAERHEAVVRALRERAARTQSPILRTLQLLAREGQVRGVRAFWIDNVVSVEATRAVIETLAERSDVEIIYSDYPIEGVLPVEEAPSAPRLTAAIENGLTEIRAPELWAVGITGAGTIVCNLDTGVDGDHEALASRWRGLQAGVPASAAWFDPVTNTTFPFDSATHGTHTMGTIAGRYAEDIIGVAYDAQWIAAGVIDRSGIDDTITDAIAAFQWAADPDGNPATHDDVPDVVSNSWGVVGGSHVPGLCETQFWGPIDNLEAAGAVVVFAAGNEGPSSATIRIPSNRVTTDLNTFAVGALEQDGTSIASFSSRGPSECDNQTVKPEVSAVGVNVRSSVPGGYSTMSGTSMATPHVAGAVALLRQAHPNATPDEIKTALYLTAVDLGTTGEDNTFGMGRIDLVEALDYLGGIGEMGRVEGTVTAQGGGAIAGAIVAVQGTGTQAVTDANGDYSLLVDGDDTYTLTASGFGYDPESIQSYVPRNDTTYIDFTLDAAALGTITGVVRDGDGDGLSGATVAVTNHTWNTATSGSGGAYSLAVPGGYSYDLSGSKPGYYSEYWGGISVAAGQTVTQDFTLNEEGGGGGICFSTEVTEGTGVEPSLNAYRALRDGVLSRSADGRRVTRIYYDYGGRMLKIALAHPSLLADTVESLRAFEPVAAELSGAESLEQVRLTDAEADAIIALLSRYGRYAEGDLAELLAEAIRFIDGLRSDAVRAVPRERMIERSGAATTFEAAPVTLH